jgi:hypothetical protein
MGETINIDGSYKNSAYKTVVCILVELDFKEEFAIMH